MTTIKLFAMVFALTAIPFAMQAQWSHIGGNLANNIGWGVGNAVSRIPDVIIDGRRTKAEERVRTAEITTQAGLCGMTTASNHNGATVKVATYPDGTPCITGTPEERVRKYETDQETARYNAQTRSEVKIARAQACSDALERVQNAAINRGDDPAMYGCNWINGGPNVFRKNPIH